MAKTFSIIGDAGLTVTLEVRRKSDGYYWNGSEYVAGATTVAMTEGAGYSDSYSEYYSETEPNAASFWKALDGSNLLIDRGEFSGIGGPASTTESSLDYLAFSDAYDLVNLNCGNLLGTTNAKRLVNESLRIIAQTEPWDWLEPSAGSSFDTVDGTASYELPVTVDQLTSAWSETYRQFAIVDARHAFAFNLADRVDGEPHTIMIIGNNVVIPDPRPDGVYTIYYNYKKLFNLVADGDKFPCGSNFVDAIVSRATWFGAEILEKAHLAQTYRKSFEEQMKSLSLSRVHRSQLSFGDSGYSVSRNRGYV